MRDLVTAFHKTETGKIEAATMSAIDRTHAVQYFPHEWSLDGKTFAAPDDPVAARRRLLASPGPEGDAARKAERTP